MYISYVNIFICIDTHMKIHIYIYGLRWLTRLFFKVPIRNHWFSSKSFHNLWNSMIFIKNIVLESNDFLQKHCKTKGQPSSPPKKKILNKIENERLSSTDHPKQKPSMVSETLSSQPFHSTAALPKQAGSQPASQPALRCHQCLVVVYLVVRSKA